MSRWNDKAERIKTHLEAMEQLAAVPISVNRVENLLTMVNDNLNKAKGTGTVIIKWLGGSNPDRKSSRLRIGSRFSISLWTAALQNHNATVTADDLIEAIAEHLHGWVDSTPGALIHRLEVTSVNLVPDAPNAIVHEVLAEIVRV